MTKTGLIDIYCFGDFKYRFAFSSRVRMLSPKVVWTCNRWDTVRLKERRKEEGKGKGRKVGTNEGKKKGMCTEQLDGQEIADLSLDCRCGVWVADSTMAFQFFYEFKIPNINTWYQIIKIINDFPPFRVFSLIFVYLFIHLIDF
jgi:hypothetical protein